MSASAKQCRSRDFAKGESLASHDPTELFQVGCQCWGLEGVGERVLYGCKVP